MCTAVTMSSVARRCSGDVNGPHPKLSPSTYGWSATAYLGNRTARCCQDGASVTHRRLTGVYRPLRT